MVNNFSDNQKLAISLAGLVLSLLVLIFVIFISKYAFYYYKSNVFFRWAKRQRLVLVEGGPASGKKMLLSYFGYQLEQDNKKNRVYNLIGLFSSDRLCDVGEKVLNLKYNGFIDSKGKTQAYFLLNELADKPAVKKCSSDSTIVGDHEIVTEIQRASYYNKKIWIAFSEKNGYLWNKLSARSSAIVTCEKISSFNFLLLKKFYLLKMRTNFDGVKTVRFVLINNSIISKYEKQWLKAFARLNPLVSKR